MIAKRIQLIVGVSVVAVLAAPFVFETVTAASASSAKAASAASCTNVGHIGDSTSVPIISALKSEYKAQGYATASVTAGNGRSVTGPGSSSLTGLQSVAKIREDGLSHCWVIALGTNDTASVRSEEQRRSRITQMMKAIGDEPVMWVNVWMDHSPNAETHSTYTKERALAWNATLESMQSQYANMSIYDWAPVVRANPSWLTGDKIHYNTNGGKQRARLIAAAASKQLGVGDTPEPPTTTVPPVVTTVPSQPNKPPVTITKPPTTTTAPPATTTPPSKPSVTALSVSGTPSVGQTLTASAQSNVSVTYQWMRCERAASGVLATCSSIAGATSATYVVVDADRTKLVGVSVTARNAAGSSSRLRLASANPIA